MVRNEGRVEVWKLVGYKMHHYAVLEDSASMQRQSIMESQLTLIEWPQLDNKVTLRCCSHAATCGRTLG